MRLLSLVYKPLGSSKRAQRRRRNPIGKDSRPERSRKDRRGVALIMVLVLTTVVAAMASDLANTSAVNLRLAANARDQLQAHFHARSAVELELFFLRFQSQLKGVIGNFIPIPMFELSSYFVSSDTMKGILDRDGKRDAEDLAIKDSYAKDQPFGDFEGSFFIEEVVDENRKININKPSLTDCLNFTHLLLVGLFDDPKYDELFEQLGDSRDPIRNRVQVIANITDWVDGNEEIDSVCTVTGDRTVSSVDEETRYNHLPYNAKYEPKNGQFVSLSELRMVPGVNDAFMTLFGPHLTVWTDDTGVNLNTASPLMLRAVIRTLTRGSAQPGDEEKFIKFIEELTLMRAMPPPLNRLSKPAFLNLVETSGFRIDQNIFQQLESKQILRFDDESNVYRITAVGRVGDATSTMTVVWRDDRAAGEIRYWREE